MTGCPWAMGRIRQGATGLLQAWLVVGAEREREGGKSTPSSVINRPADASWQSKSRSRRALGRRESEIAHLGSCAAGRGYYLVLADSDRRWRR